MGARGRLFGFGLCVCQDSGDCYCYCFGPRVLAFAETCKYQSMDKHVADLLHMLLIAGKLRLKLIPKL